MGGEEVNGYVGNMVVIKYTTVSCSHKQISGPCTVKQRGVTDVVTNATYRHTITLKSA